MTDIGEGDWVKCIQSKNSNNYKLNLAKYIGNAFIKENFIYQIKEIVRENEYNNGHIDKNCPGFVLHETETHWISWSGNLGAWSVNYFIPIYRKNEEITQGLLKGIYSNSKEDSKVPLTKVPEKV